MGGGTHHLARTNNQVIRKRKRQAIRVSHRGIEDKTFGYEIDSPVASSMWTGRLVNRLRGFVWLRTRQHLFPASEIPNARCSGIKNTHPIVLGLPAFVSPRQL